MPIKFIQKGSVVLCLMFFSYLVVAQNEQVINLRLDDALARTEANNYQLKIVNYELAGALEDTEKMKSVYLPQISASATGTATNIPLNAFGTKLQQGAITQTDFNPDELNEPSSVSNLNTQITVRQPIYNADASAAKKAVSAKSKAYNYQVVRTRKVLRNHVVRAYLRLQLMYEISDVLKKAKATAEANLKLAEDNLNAGYIQLADVLSVKVRINEIETEIFQTENNILNISDQLSFLMGTDFGQKYEPTDKLAIADESLVPADEVLTTRSDIKAMESQVEAYRYMLDAAEKADIPRLNAFGTYGLNNSFDFDESQHGFMVGLEASWDIFNGNKNRSAARKAKIELDKSQTQLTQLVSKNKLEYEMVRRKISEAQQKIKFAEIAVKQSKESLRIKTDRFAEGLEKTTDILISETLVAQKELEYTEAIFRYKAAYSELLLMLEKD